MIRAEKLFWIRRELGVTQLEIARMAGVSIALVSYWKDEKRNSPKVEKTVDRLWKKISRKAA